MTAEPAITPHELELIEEALPTRRVNLGRKDWIVLIAMFGFVLLLNIVGWGTLMGIVAPQHLSVGNGAIFGIGSGSPPTRWACGTPSTPTTSPPSTTPRAS
jgi:high-affinity nickel-transport protein